MMVASETPVDSCALVVRPTPLSLSDLIEYLFFKKSRLIRFDVYFFGNLRSLYRLFRL